jgi:hypothetical protein
MLKMNSQIREFFRVDGTQDPHFQEVKFLSEEVGLGWDEVSGTGIPRGWFELSQVGMEDRVGFTKDFWLGTLPYHPKGTGVIEDFFDRLDDVAVILCRQTKEEPWRAELVYSLRDNSSFFRGLVPAESETIDWVQRKLGAALPRDYRAFLNLHDGFGKLTELGVMPIEDLEEAHRELVELILRSEPLLRSGETVVDPHSLYPFYEEYGMGSFQCFHSEWYPGSEMGNVYFSGIDYMVSDVSERKGWAENLAYPTFLEWLASFLEGMNVSP